MTVIAGPDEHGLGDALRDRGLDPERIEGVVTREKLLAAGIEEADTFVLTTVEDATAVPIAKDDNPDVRVVVYAERSLPEFVRGQVDLAVDPDLLDPAAVAEELAA